MTAQRADLVPKQSGDLDPTLLNVFAQLLPDLLRPVLEELLDRPGPLDAVPVSRLDRPVVCLFAEAENIVIESLVLVQHIFQRVGVAQIVVRDRNDVDFPMPTGLPCHLVAVQRLSVDAEHKFDRRRLADVRDVSLDGRLALLELAQFREGFLSAELDLETACHGFAVVFHRNVHNLLQRVVVVYVEHRGFHAHQTQARRRGLGCGKVCDMQRKIKLSTASSQCLRVICRTACRFIACSLLCRARVTWTVSRPVKSGWLAQPLCGPAGHSPTGRIVDAANSVHQVPLPSPRGTSALFWRQNEEKEVISFPRHVQVPGLLEIALEHSVVRGQIE